LGTGKFIWGAGRSPIDLSFPSQSSPTHNTTTPSFGSITYATWNASDDGGHRRKCCWRWYHHPLHLTWSTFVATPTTSSSCEIWMGTWQPHYLHCLPGDLEQTMLLLFLLARATVAGFTTVRGHTPILELRLDITHSNTKSRGCHDQDRHGSRLRLVDDGFVSFSLLSVSDLNGWGWMIV